MDLATFRHPFVSIAGERIALAITLLLAMTVFMLVVAEMIPPTSEVVPLVGIFFNCAMVEMVLMIIILCVILKFYHKEPSDPPMPKWMRKYILNWLSYALHIRQRRSLSDANDNKQVDQIELTYLSRTIDNSKSNGHGRFQLSRGHPAAPQRPFIKPGVPNGLMKRRADKYLDNASTAVSEMSTHYDEHEAIAKKLDVIIDKMVQKEKGEKFKQEWRIVAMTIDRCLFYAFCSITILTIGVIFFSSPGYVS